MNLVELIAKLLTEQGATDQDRREAGMSVLPQAGGIQQTAQLADLRRQIMEAYRIGDYDRAAQLQDLMTRMQPQPMMDQAGVM